MNPGQISRERIADEVEAGLTFYFYFLFEDHPELDDLTAGQLRKIAKVASRIIRGEKVIPDWIVEAVKKAKHEQGGGPERFRTTKKYDARKGGWFEIPFESLKAGDIFCLFEPDGKTVVHQGKYFSIAVGDAYVRDGVPSIESEPYHGKDIPPPERPAG